MNINCYNTESYNASQIDYQSTSNIVVSVNQPVAINPQDFIAAAKNGDLVLIQEFLEDGSVDPNYQDENKKTALMYAAQEGWIDVVKILIENKADLDIYDNTKKNALMYAAGHGHKEIIDILLESGANLDAQERFGWTAFMMAIKAGYIKIVNLFIKHQTSINLKNKEGETSLTIAKNMSPVIYKKLKKKGLNKGNLKDYNKFVNIVKTLCHIKGVDGDSVYLNGNDKYIFSRLGMLGDLFSKPLSKQLRLFHTHFPDLVPPEFIKKICFVLKSYNKNNDTSLNVRSKKIAKQYKKDDIVLISTGFNGHAVVELLCHGYGMRSNRGSSSKKSLQIFPIQIQDDKSLTKYISKLRSVAHQSQQKYKEIVGKTSPSTGVELQLEQLLELPMQKVGNCSWTSLEGALLALFIFEGLHLENLLPLASKNINQIQEVVQTYKSIFDNFIRFFEKNITQKYLDFVRNRPHLKEEDIIHECYS